MLRSKTDLESDDEAVFAGEEDVEVAHHVVPKDEEESANENSLSVKFRSKTAQMERTYEGI